MLRHYGASVAGAYHAAAGEDGQDAFAVLRLAVDARAGGAGLNEPLAGGGVSDDVDSAGGDSAGDGPACDDSARADCAAADRTAGGDGGEVVFAAVADGLGSERRSGEGARVAADVAVRALAAASLGARGIASLDENALLSVLEVALEAVLARAEEAGEDAGEFDSTLCLVAWDGDAAVYANAGDSGVIASMIDGGEATYRLLTSMHRGEARNLVYPLKSRGQWEFGRAEGVRSLFLATDGILEQVAGTGLGDDPVELNRAALDLFMRIGPEEAGDPDGLSRGLADYLGRIDPLAVDDDKTVVVLYDDAASSCEGNGDADADADADGDDAVSVPAARDDGDVLDGVGFPEGPDAADEPERSLL